MNFLLIKNFHIRILNHYLGHLPRQNHQLRRGCKWFCLLFLRLVVNLWNPKSINQKTFTIHLTTYIFSNGSLRFFFASSSEELNSPILKVPRVSGLTVGSSCVIFSFSGLNSFTAVFPFDSSCWYSFNFTLPNFLFVRTDRWVSDLMVTITSLMCSRKGISSWLWMFLLDAQPKTCLTFLSSFKVWIIDAIEDSSWSSSNFENGSRTTAVQTGNSRTPLQAS